MGSFLPFVIVGKQRRGRNNMEANMLFNVFSDSLCTFKKQYFEYRYWNHLIKNMVRQLPDQFNKNQSGTIPFINKPGIAFSFDDSFRIKHWYKYGKKIFKDHDVKVTFNINKFHHYEGQRTHTQEEIDMLLNLQSDGHEIGHHGLKHRNVTKYAKKVGIHKWLEDEIIALFKWTENQSHSKTGERFKQPISFALPYSDYENEIISALIPQFYKVVRGNIYKENLTGFHCSGFAPSICIDSVYLSNAKYIEKLIRIAKKTGKNLIFMCHSILPEDVAWEEFGWENDYSGVDWWRISPNRLLEIINLGRKHDMEFYTTAELAGAATFIDPNLERAVRKHLEDPSVKWISINELSTLKEIDLSHMKISNLDGIQYLLNLEKLNLGNNKISDFRLLEKLPKLKEVKLNRNPGFIYQESNLPEAREHISLVR